MHMGVVWVLCVWFGGHVQTVSGTPAFDSINACDAWLKERKIEDVMCWPRPALVFEFGGSPSAGGSGPSGPVAPAPGGGGRMLMDKE